MAELAGYIIIIICNGKLIFISAGLGIDTTVTLQGLYSPLIMIVLNMRTLMAMVAPAIK
jgi:hypothetical protein